MPLLRFGKERLDPDLSFAHRLPVGLGRVVAAYPVEVASVEGAVHDPPVIAGRAGSFDGTGVAGRRVGSIHYLRLGVLGLATRQRLSCGQRYSSRSTS